MGNRHIRSLAIAALAVTLSPLAAHAQAWVPDQGNLGLDLDYNFFTSSRVVTDTTENFEDAGTTGHQLSIGAEYTPIDKLSITATIPMVSLKYTGDQVMWAHPGGGEYDDGDYHTTLTDFRAGVRYAVLEEPVALAPHLAFTVPMADYETVGNTVAGRGLMAAHLGLSVGKIFGYATYAHLSYEFTLSQKYDRTDETAEIGQNRSDMSLSVGHKLLDFKLDLHVAADFRLYHGGVTFSELEDGMLTPDQALYHDPLLKEQVLVVGAGGGYNLTDKLSATLDFRFFIEALSQNTLNASVIALGFSYTAL